MDKQSKKALYESIMKSVAKTVKNALNENRVGNKYVYVIYWRYEHAEQQSIYGIYNGRNYKKEWLNKLCEWQAMGPDDVLLLYLLRFTLDEYTELKPMIKEIYSSNNEELDFDFSDYFEDSNVLECAECDMEALELYQILLDDDVIDGALDYEDFYRNYLNGEYDEYQDYL